MEKLTKLMMVHDFVDGGNDFDRRFEAVERQCVMLSTYTDIISLQPPGTPVEESALDLLVDIVKFLWRALPHRGRQDAAAALGRDGRVLRRAPQARRGDVTSRICVEGHQVAGGAHPPRCPADPIDSALFRAPPSPSGRVT